MKTLQIIGLILLLAAVANAQTLLGISTSPTGGGTPVAPTCDGTIDLSKGCTQPMLGVM